ncbi:MAG: hypothetical protein SFW67_17910 [Myxococcaceae bacterium]|nr:hypothetical protein [Myxococcaceae bacterium]
MMTSCERFEEELIEQGLTPAVVAHAAGCVSCSASLEAARSLAGLGLEAPPTAEEQLAADAWTQRALAVRAQHPRRRPTWVWPVLAAAAAIMLVVALGRVEPAREAERAAPADDGPPRAVSAEPRVRAAVQFVAGAPRCVVDDATGASLCISGDGVLADGRLTLAEGTATIDTQRAIDVAVAHRRITVERGWVELRVVRGVIAGVVAEDEAVLRSEGLEVRRVSRRELASTPAVVVARPPVAQRRERPESRPPNDPQPVGADAVAMALRRARDARRVGDVTAALAAYETVLQRSTDSQTRQFALVAIGELSLQAGRADAACEAFDRARREPGSLAREAWLGQIACLRVVDPPRARTQADAFRSAFPEDPATSTLPSAPP